MGYKAAAQLLKKADDLKLKVTQKCDLLTDSDAWTDQQKLQTVYHQVLVLDLEYALDKKVEQELWTVGFKNHITNLQEISRDKKHSKRSEAQALLSWCLEAASGFYLSLLQELCTSFGLDLPFRRRGTVYGHMRDSVCTDSNQTQSSSCLYIVQYCLVHLGDIARYRNQRKQAESFYKQAIMVSPTSGHPYNQLALLEASQGNKLSTVFHYVRGIAVKNPFPASVTNLTNSFSIAIDKEGPITNLNTKMTAGEFTQLFLSVHGLLHSTSDLNQAEIGVKSMNATLTALVATQSFNMEKLIEITIINLYAWKHVNNTSYEDLTQDEIKVRQLVLDLLAGSLNAFLLPVHTLAIDESLLEYYALPAVKFLIYWIQEEPEVLKENMFTSRLQIWPSLCKFLNSSQQFLKDFDYSDYRQIPLPEDKDMQGFLPLAKVFSNLDFKTETVDDLKIQSFIRTKRIIDFGLWLIDEENLNNAKLVTIREKGEDFVSFEPGCIQPDPTENLLEEMKSFSIIEVIEEPNKTKEKRGGILKPQGSLEKSREEREKQENSIKDIGAILDMPSPKTGSLANKIESAKLKRVRQNVALQSIFKKMEENKQVKFNVETTAKEKDKILKFETKPAVKPLPPQTSQSFRTQAFNQNHPGLSSMQGELPKELINMNFQTQPMVNYDRNPNPNMPKAYPNQVPATFNNAPNMGQQSSAFNMLPQTQPSMPYQNMPSYPQFNNWKPEGTAQPIANTLNTPSWPWSNMNPALGQAQNFPQQQPQDKYPGNYPYGNNMSFFGNNPNNSHQQDMYSPWNTQRNIIPNQGMMGYDSNNQNLSMRQAMLKETSNMPGMSNFNNPQMSRTNSQVPQNNQGYSLFNANGWNPNLPGQLKTSMNMSSGSSMQNQQSLFAGQAGGPLAQLLEQQNQWKKNDH